MALAPRLWSWSPITSRWIPASEKGAWNQFMAQGREVAWGGAPPKRNGSDPENYPPLLRPTQWSAFTSAVIADPGTRHRIAPV